MVSGFAGQRAELTRATVVAGAVRDAVQSTDDLIASAFSGLI